MADEWDKYIVEEAPQDEWEQYAVETPKQAKPSMEKQNAMGKVFNVPAAALRSSIRGKGYIGGALNPSKVPTFQNEFQNQVSNLAAKIPNEPLRNYVAFMGAQSVQPVGAVADFVTNPAELGLALAPYAPGVKQAVNAVGKAVSPAVKAVGNNPAVQALGRFMTKKRSFLKFGKDAVLKISEKGVSGLDKLDDLASQKYEEGLNSIKGKSKNIKPIIEQMDEAISSYPDQKFLTLEKIKERISQVDELSATELLNIKQEVKRGIPKAVFQGKADPTPQQYAQLKVYNQVDDALVELGGDKYKGMKAEYRDWKNTSQDAYRALLEDGRPGDAKLRNWFGYGLSRRQMKSLDKANFMLKPEDQFMQDFYAWRRGQVVKGAAGATLGAGLLDYLAHRGVAEKVMPRD